MTIELVPLCTATARLSAPFLLPDTPLGTRAIAEVTSFDVEGERIRGHLAGNAGADWLTVGPGGMGTLDVRVLIETDDGALIFASYRGRLDLANGVGASPPTRHHCSTPATSATRGSTPSRRSPRGRSPRADPS